MNRDLMYFAITEFNICENYCEQHNNSTNNMGAIKQSEWLKYIQGYDAVNEFYSFLQK